ncbi:MAG: crotonase/enoyl-CoA hydratase family protein [Burkholderiales bacterium]|nr:crotonase/enoyl-CoA hydratase family protein [Burkholderiales bacterium]HNQ57963.1 crotonase/enoyl-CoA hydratase family protein [Candidatus Desulfobacillus denitrificans]HNT61309.1 crotonase/enoyl-CoA hydratase family protein [Candidatus Desulfobacillus denitrificans]
MSAPAYETLKIELLDGVATVEMNRPEKANAMNLRMWLELREAFKWVDEAPEVRVAVLRGAGPCFTAGIDLELLAGVRQEIADPCDGRMRERLRRLILDLQDSLTALERCRKPVLAAIHGHCLGGGVDLICACDMRYCCNDASFSIKEIDVGMTADVGTLQRLPKLIGEGMVRELAYTGRAVAGTEAKEIGLVNHGYASAGMLFHEVAKIAATIAKKSPLSIRGIKEMVNYARDHSVADGLNYIATWNAAMLMSEDLTEAMTAMRAKREPKFRD